MIVKSFILENWRLIIDILSVICVTIFFFIKKKPNKVINSIYEWIMLELPFLINGAENLFGSGNGDLKMQHCVDVICDCLHKTHPEVDVKQYIPFIKKQVENILSTPQKKGEIEDGKK